MGRDLRFGGNAEPLPAGPEEGQAVKPTGRSDSSPAARDWPTWEPPSEEDSLLLARVLARHARFLAPDIVRLLVEDNERRASSWRSQLSALGVPPDAYLWERSPCAFPGVRRYAGSDEIAVFRGRKKGDGALLPDALQLDDNDYPKHVWSLLYRGKPFQKQGPLGYNLAHLADHKSHNNRASENFEVEAGVSVDRRLHGLFTCPTNTVFLPAGLLKPTDFHPKVRGLFIRKAEQVYGLVCRIVPPCMSVLKCDEADWGIDRFDWPVFAGDSTRLEPFLSFRATRMEELLTLARQKSPVAG